jgi:hypothetical protein
MAEREGWSSQTTSPDTEMRMAVAPPGYESYRGAGYSIYEPAA